MTEKRRHLARPLGRAILCGAVIAVLAAASLPASSFVALDRAELVERSQHVVEGRVIDARSFWTPQRRAIVTDVRIAVDDSIVGARDRELTVRTFGGKVGDYVIEALGFPRFEVGDRVLLFVRDEPSDGSLRVTGYQQGHFRIVERGGVDVAVPTLDSGTSLVVPQGKTVPPSEVVPLDDLKGELRRLVAAKGVSR